MVTTTVTRGRSQRVIEFLIESFFMVSSTGNSIRREMKRHLGKSMESCFLLLLYICSLIHFFL